MGTIETAKKGNTIAMKLLIDLCNVVDPDGVGDGSDAGITFTDLIGLSTKCMPELQNPAADEPTRAGIAVAPGDRETE